MTPVPEDLKYTKEHVWARPEGDAVRIGVTEHLVDQLGRVIEVELPEAGTAADLGKELGHLTGSATGAHDIFPPVEGVVGEVNEELLEDPDILTGDPYDEGWFCIITNHDPDEVDALMDHEEYEATLED